MKKQLRLACALGAALLLGVTSRGDAASFIPGISTLPYTGSGSLTATTASVLINTMLVDPASGALPTTFTGLLTAVNVGAVDAALCPNVTTAGAVCTCPENGALTSNGITLRAAGGGYTLNLAGRASAAPTVVACSGTAVIQFQW